VYSDLGYIILGYLIEKIEEKNLATIFKQKICDPLQLTEKLFFLSICPYLSVKKEKIAATEDCPWRKKLIQGEVHDEHCWLMGGVAGHAGLFGTAESVLVLCETLLDCWQGTKHHPAFTNGVLRHAFEWKKETSNWALGFDRPTPGKSSCGHFISAQSVGHLGFTGTSFWIDPQHNVVVVLLTNRVHPSRENMKIREFRPLFHNTLMNNILN
jgi:CubicO group peptidase (beta-lactamase class C family)